MPRAGLSVAVLGLVLLGRFGGARPAAAEPIGPALDITIGGGLYTGDLGARADRLAVEYRIGAGLSRGPWSALLSVHLHQLRALAEPRDMTPVSYLGVGVEPSVRRELTVGAGLRMHLRLGYAWRWLQGDRSVTRLCDVHGGCDGGYWQETPTYAANGPVLAFGLGGRLRGDIWPAFGVELAVGHVTLDRLGLDPDLRGTFVSLGLNLSVGRAR